MFINPKANLFKLISLNFRKFQSLLDIEFKKINITRGEYPFLVSLYRSTEGLNQNQLSNNLGVDRAHTNRYVKRLIASGYIENMSNTSKCSLHLTEKGIETAKEIIKIINYCSSKILSDISEEEILSLTSSLEKINLSLDNINKN